MKHFGIYANSGDVQTAINEEVLANPYVALVSGALDYNTLAPVEPVIEYSAMPLTFEFLEDGTIHLEGGMNEGVRYSLNDGEWTAPNDEEGEDLSVSSGDTLAFKSLPLSFNSMSYSTEVPFNAYGNAMSLVMTGFDQDFTQIMTLGGENGSLVNLFAEKPVVNAEHLVLPATALTIGEGYDAPYAGMFENCTSLVSVPRLVNATVTVTGGNPDPYYGGVYSRMFNGCSSLSAVPADMLSGITLSYACYDGMFALCNSLEVAPVLTAPVLNADNCYDAMFVGCDSLTSVTCLATSIANGVTPFYYGDGEHDNWIDGSWDGGTFYKAANTTIPWCVVPEDDSEYELTGYEVGPYTWTIQNYSE